VIYTTDENVNPWWAWPGCARGWLLPAAAAWSCGPQPRVKVQRPAGRTTLTAARTAVASG